MTGKQPNDSEGEATQPQAGDIWEFRLPGKRKRVKEVGSVGQVWGKRVDGTEGHYPYVYWQREPKGRYSGLSVRLLLLHGRRVSTKAERDAHLNAQIEKAKRRREEERRQAGGRPCQR